MSRFEGRVAIVTGAAGGFGAEVSRRLAEEGATVVMVDRDGPAIAAAAATVERADAIAADVRVTADVERYVADTVARHGTVDLFFNNAGIEGRMAPMTEMTDEDFDSVIAVNVRGVFLGLREVLRVMKAKGSGAVVNTASMAAVRGAPTFAPYVTSKHAVMGLTRCAALEGAPHGIRVNAVAPGYIDTRMLRDLAAQTDPDDPAGALGGFGAAVPLGRNGTAAEVAALTLWLLSDEAAYVTGSLHLVDGGLNA